MASSPIVVDKTLHACSHNFQISCGNCRLNSICLPLALDSEDVSQLDEIIQRSSPLQKGEHLYRQDQPFESVFAVRSGTVKAYRTTDDGKEQITGFYFPGEVLGMDGISNDLHASSAKALETAAVCEVSFFLSREPRSGNASATATFCATDEPRDYQGPGAHYAVE